MGKREEGEDANSVKDAVLIPTCLAAIPAREGTRRGSSYMYPPPGSGPPSFPRRVTSLHLPNSSCQRQRDLTFVLDGWEMRDTCSLELCHNAQHHPARLEHGGTASPAPRDTLCLPRRDATRGQSARIFEKSSAAHRNPDGLPVSSYDMYAGRSRCYGERGAGFTLGTSDPVAIVAPASTGKITPVIL
jgi:hypothetical protein